MVVSTVGGMPGLVVAHLRLQCSDMGIWVGTDQLTGV
jgi:hypothetical protein